MINKYFKAVLLTIFLIVTALTVLAEVFLSDSMVIIGLLILILIALVTLIVQLEVRDE